MWANRGANLRATRLYLSARPRARLIMVRPLRAAYWVKVKVLFILPWIAASTNEVGFHAGPVYLPQPSLKAARSWPGVGWSNASEVSSVPKETQPLELPHIPNYTELDRLEQVALLLAQENRAALHPADAATDRSQWFRDHSESRIHCWDWG